MAATLEIIGAYYAFCRKCGGQVGSCAVMSDEDRRIQYEDGITTYRAFTSQFISEMKALGYEVEFYRLQDNPGPCDCEALSA